MTSNNKNTEKLIKELSEEWGQNVYIKYNPQFDEWLVSNTTDEGLPSDIDKSITVYADSLEKAVEKAENAEGRDRSY